MFVCLMGVLCGGVWDWFGYAVIVHGSWTCGLILVWGGGGDKWDQWASLVLLGFLHGGL